MNLSFSAINWEAFIILLIFGIGGIFGHHLAELNKANRKAKGVINYREYFSLEYVSFLFSLMLVLLVVFGAMFIPELAQAGWKLFIGIAFVGFGGQNVFSNVMGHAETEINRRLGIGDKV